jgi:steroid 5-alpha reductase family enzyme
MCFWFLIALIIKRNDVADIAWGGGFLLCVSASLLLGNQLTIRNILITSLVMVWSLRLSLHIYMRNRFKPEDARYQAWRLSWGAWFYLRSFFQIFIFQGLLLLLVVSPVVISNVFGGKKVSLLDILGIAIWIFGFLFETISDWQLKNFVKISENKGKIIQTGLWRYSRHPNYFGEVTCWWGLWVVALSVPYGVIGIIGPLIITFLILKVSGIPLLEKRMKEKPGFEDYAKKTSIFFPLPIKNK